MSAPPTYPGVYIQEFPGGARNITGVATSIALFIGWAPRGPTDRPLRLTSFADFGRLYGGLDRRSLLGYAMGQFFANGGSETYVVRIAGGDATLAEASLGDLTLTADSPGEWANEYRIRLTQRGDDASRFMLEVLHKPTKDFVVESFEDLSMNGAATRFVETVVNGSSEIIRAAAGGSGTPARATVDLSGGQDGTAIGPADATFRAALLGCLGRGSITDRIDLFNLLCVPGLTDPTTVAQLQQHCQERRAFLILDSRHDDTVSSIPSSLPALAGVHASNSALYFPWVLAPDVLDKGQIRAFPPSGFIAGVLARTDVTRGVWKAPAGSEASLNGASGLAIAVSGHVNEQLNPRGINCLRTFPNFGIVVWGSRTLAGDDERASEWKYISVRRLALFLEESLQRGTRWAVFEPNDEALWTQIRLNVGAFMQDLFRQGAFQGSSPKEAYLVRCDRETTTQNDINQGIVNLLVGFAPLKPAEFVVIKVQLKAGQVAA